MTASGRVFAPPGGCSLGVGVSLPPVHSQLHGIGIETILNSGGMGGAQTPTPKEQPPGGAKTFPEAVTFIVSSSKKNCFKKKRWRTNRWPTNE